MKGACHCGATKWRKDQADGYQVEEVADDEAFIGTQTRSIKRRSTRGSNKKDKVRVLKQPAHIKLLRFQGTLRAQSKWLITRKGYPPQFEDVVHDIWILWLKHKGEQEVLLNFDGTGRKLAKFKKHPIKPWHTLILLTIAAFILKIPLAISDLTKLVFSTDFPYFAALSMEQNQSNFTGGYTGVPSMTKLTKEVTMVIQNMYTAGLTFSSDPDQPLMILRLFDALELPKVMYLHYQTISTLKGKQRVENPNPIELFLHMSVCCLWLSKVYRNKTIKPTKANPMSFVLNGKIDLRAPFIHARSVIVPQKKKGVDKIAYSVLLDSLADRPRTTIPLRDRVEVVQSYRSISELNESEITLSGKDLVHGQTKEIKSYFLADLDGAIETDIASDIGKVSSLSGIEPLKLLAALRDLELILHCYSISI